MILLSIKLIQIMQHFERHLFLEFISFNILFYYIENITYSQKNNQIFDQINIKCTNENIIFLILLTK